MEEIKGYHTVKIEKGVLGDFSKIKEEFDELVDAHKQENKVLELCELSDLLGAIKHYAAGKFGMSLDDLLKFMESTERAFENGGRE